MLSDLMHTRIDIIITKSCPSVVKCSFQDFKQEKSDKTELLFC